MLKRCSPWFAVPAVLVLLAIYLGFILDITLLHFQGKPGVNLVPFQAIIRDVREGGRNFVVNVLGNLGVFVPLGLAIPILRERPTRAWHVALIGFVLSLGIELAQYALGRRVADIDDVLMNTTGAVLGYAASTSGRWRNDPR